MKTRTLIKKPMSVRRRVAQARALPHMRCVGRRSLAEFSCGIEDARTSRAAVLLDRECKGRLL